MSCSPVMTNPREKLEAIITYRSNCKCHSPKCRPSTGFMRTRLSLSWTPVVCSVHLDERHNLVHSSNENDRHNLEIVVTRHQSRATQSSFVRCKERCKCAQGKLENARHFIGACAVSSWTEISRSLSTFDVRDKSSGMFALSLLGLVQREYR
jgi:hypothetical protein